MRLRTTAFPRAFFTLMPKRLGCSAPEAGAGITAAPIPSSKLTPEARFAANTVCERKKTAN
jgi:hypothetical protein